MNRMSRLCSVLVTAALLVATASLASAQTIQNYTAYPPFMNKTVPPLVMLVMDRSHRQFLKAYNDVTDLDGDGTIDTTYKDTIAYDGYFDWTKCYTYNTGASPSARFEPVGSATGANGHYCSGNWSGNFLNWAAMARIDVMRKVLYGGHRTIDTSTTTVLSRTLLTRDGHSWAKVYNGTDISSLTPFAWTNITLCNTNTYVSSSPTGTQSSGQIMVINGYYPYAASTENQQCLWQYQYQVYGFPFGPALSPYGTYNADVLVCVPSMLEATCQTYTDSTSTNHYKPTGLMQSMGVTIQGSTASTDVIHMNFALISGSYGAHVSGGVLRSNIVNVDSEIDRATGMIASTSQIIANIEKFQLVQYSYLPWNGSTGVHGGWYYGSPSASSNVARNNCVQGEPTDLSTIGNAYCESWGNPMGEMFYEAIRYFMGKSGPTTQYQQASADAGLLGLTVASSWQDPYASCPYCSKPFILMLSDPRPSFDSDELPGAYWPKAISTSDVPSVQTLIANANINALENIGNVYIGQSGAVTDRNCTPKAGNFANIRGLCIEEPTKQGSYYLAGLANYAKTTDLRPSLQNAQSITTYSVVSNPPFPTLTFPVGSSTVQIIPDFHDGCPSANWGSPGYTGCTAQGTNGDNSGGEIVDFQLCFNDADWTTEQGNGFTSCYDILWDDADNGWDYELDIRMRIYVKTTSTQITVKTKGMYGAAGHTDYAGYFINGVSGAGQYLDLSCGGQNGFNACNPYTSVHSISGAWSQNATAVTRTFTVSGATAQVLQDPLWYAAKYGGFQDQNGSNTPDLPQEWDQDGDGVPDTYFYTSNPLQLQAQLGAAFVSILNTAGSGTAISVLANSSAGDGTLYQSFFFPSVLEPATLNEVRWVGYTQGLFVDAYGNTREDTNGDGRLIYQNDLIVQTFYDSNPASLTYGQTLANKFLDADGDGFADSATPTFANQPLTSVVPVWEAGKQLALMSPNARNIQTWVDTNNNGLVDVGEQIAFSTANDTTLGPYLRAGAAPYTADNIINFILGTQVTGMRDRQRTVNGGLQVWKLGDSIYSTPIVVAAPRERFDVLYSDASYTAFYQQYQNRRQVIYMGANDGMLHAINGGFYHPGDDPTTTSVTEHGWFTTTPANNSGLPHLGDELWGFIPYQLLPQLQWLTQTGYTHVYYVDLKPKVTDVRIFTPDANHPNGWGTILIGGFRMGGSCGSCTAASGAPPMSVTANFGSGTQTRTFYSAYFVLDITNPEVAPTLLWSFSDSTLGLTTSYPAVVRMSAPGSNTDNTLAKWFAVFGSGMTGYDGSIAQMANLYAVDLAAGPGSANSLVTKMPAGTSFNSWMGDIIAVDVNFDWRYDAVYAGRAINDGTTPWRGKMYRLTTGGCVGAPCTPGTWGIASGANRIPTEVLDTFPQSTNAKIPGPIISAPAVTIDGGGKVWLFFGTGRYYNQQDKTDTTTEYLFGIKDSVVGTSPPCAQTSATSCWDNNLVDVSNASICITCVSGTNQVTGVTGVTTLSGSSTSMLQGLVASMDGWFLTLPGAGERSLSSPTAIGGVIFLTTFIPSTDVCVAAGNSNLYALYYLTGTASTSPFIGTTQSGGNTNANASISLGTGLASSMAVQTISQGGSGALGSSSPSQGCSGTVMGHIQGSTGAALSLCANTGNIRSRQLAWINQRD